MTDRYAVFGNPISHSKSPLIHTCFAKESGQDLHYEALAAPLDGFATAIADFQANGGKGANVTVPFKEEAFRLCQQLSPRAERAGAVNTLLFTTDGLRGDNTDGIGLVRDLTHNLGRDLTGRRILLLGAGGAARGALAPLLSCQPASLYIANIFPEIAAQLAAGVADLLKVNTGDFEDLEGKTFDVIINATSASLSGLLLPLPPGLFASGSLAYDMMYDSSETVFMAQAQSMGAAVVADGLGMLVEQAAEAFALWRGIRPETASVQAELRQLLSAQ